ncbi:MAG: hypothetical protein CM1200mP20_01760 [Pseudomonadota bacterium]|nr:MAG: hypothetical protein CM1200mP20_01760 [Pseudomonadota bacterium]
MIVLQRFFRLSHDDAVQVMLNVHTRGSGVCGVYPFEIAQTKVREVMNFRKTTNTRFNALWSRNNAVEGA